MNRKLLLNKDIAFSTIFVFACVWLLKFSFIHLHALDPIEKALSDFEYTDLVYHHKKENPPPVTDSHIAIVDIGNSRAEIAQELEVLARYKPKVVAVDAWFEQPKEAASDSTLLQACAQLPNVVLGGYLQKAQNSETLQRVQSFQALQHVSHFGYGNFVAGYEKTIRTFTPEIELEGEPVYSFSAQIVRLFEPSKYEVLAKRHQPVEYINYAKTADQFIPHFTLSEMYEGNPALEALTGKIVLIGKTDNNELDDLHFTPFNDELAGRSKPDMSGIFIHANIIEMMLNENYINQIPDSLVLLLSVFITYTLIIFYVFYFVEKHIWYHLFAKVIQLLMLFILTFAKLKMLSAFSLMFNDFIIAVPLILAVDLLYFYDAIVKWLHQKFGYQTYFISHH